MIRSAMRAARFLGVAALAGSAALLLWHVAPGAFPNRTHEFLASFALGAVALAWLLWQASQKPGSRHLLRAVLLAAAFLFWSANQLWPDIRPATLFNDAAVGLFVLDVYLAMIGWPPGTDG